MQKIIVTDMDDVLVDLLPIWIKCLNERYNKSVRYEDITEWRMKVAYPDLTDKQLYGILNEEHLWQQVKPKGTSVEDVKMLVSKGYKVYVCTASHYKTVSNKMTHALFPYFDFDYRDIIVCHDKHLVQCDYLIDDNPENLKHSSAVTFLMDAPYNQTADERYYDFRVTSLSDMYNIIKELEALKDV